MFSHLKRQFTTAGSRRRKAGRQFRVEGLERRALLTLTAINFGATVESTPVAVGGELFFAAYDPTHGTQLWESNGTAAGTVRISDGNDGAGGIQPTDLTAVGNTLYFSANDGSAGQQLWESDGTVSGTAMVTDSNDGVPGFGLYPSDLTNVNGTLYFAGYDLNDGYQVFESNGTAAGTTMVAALNGGHSAYVSNLAAVGSTLYFQAYDATHGYQLWATSGTSGTTTMLTNINDASGGSYPAELTAVGSALYFDADDGVHGYQLWSSNGTASGTVRLSDGNDTAGGLSPADLTAVGSTLYFSADDGVHGYQLWSSNGTASGTAMLTGGNVAAGGLEPADLTAVGGTLYFTADDGVHGYQLWSSNGTAAGTAMVAEINGTAGSSPANLMAMNGALYFTAYTATAGYQVWQSNGTSGGTVMDTSLNTGGTNVPSNFAIMGSPIDSLYFTAPGATMWQWQPTPTPTPTRPDPHADADPDPDPDSHDDRLADRTEHDDRGELDQGCSSTRLTRRRPPRSSDRTRRPRGTGSGPTARRATTSSATRPACPATPPSPPRARRTGSGPPARTPRRPWRTPAAPAAIAACWYCADQLHGGRGPDRRPGARPGPLLHGLGRQRDAERAGAAQQRRDGCGAEYPDGLVVRRGRVPAVDGQRERGDHDHAGVRAQRRAQRPVLRPGFFDGDDDRLAHRTEHDDRGELDRDLRLAGLRRHRRRGQPARLRHRHPLGRVELVWATSTERPAGPGEPRRLRRDRRLLVLADQLHGGRGPDRRPGARPGPLLHGLGRQRDAERAGAAQQRRDGCGAEYPDGLVVRRGRVPAVAGQRERGDHDHAGVRAQRRAQRPVLRPGELSWPVDRVSLLRRQVQGDRCPRLETSSATSALRVIKPPGLGGGPRSGRSSRHHTTTGPSTRGSPKPGAPNPGPVAAFAPRHDDPPIRQSFLAHVGDLV